MARQMHCDYISKKIKERKGREWGEIKEEGAKKKKEKGANVAYKWEVQPEKLLMLYRIPLGSRLVFFSHQRLFCILIISFSSKQFRPSCLFPSDWGF